RRRGPHGGAGADHDQCGGARVARGDPHLPELVAGGRNRRPLAVAEAARKEVRRPERGLTFAPFSDGPRAAREQIHLDPGWDVTWLQRYRIRHYVENAIWIWPVVAIVAALIAVRILHWLEESLGWELAVNPETARTLLGALAGAMFTFIVFVCSAL